ncbi:MAG: hypothetical protein QOE33_2596 [Acidobacteriota bacterium]|nr:hypothetical protein [Acidobacteriota bacterium]
MRTLNRSIIFAALLVAALSATALAKKTINQINADPSRYRDKTISIVGTVTDSYGVLGNGAYEIDDGTGRMWVVADRTVPARGSRVETKGHVMTGFILRGHNMGTVLRESGRKAKDR